MPHKRNAKKNNQNKQLMLLIVLLIVLILIVLSLAGGIQKNRKINVEIDELEGEIYDLEQNNLELTELIEYFNSTAFIEQKARADLGLKKPGEEVFVVAEEMLESPETTPQINAENQKKSNFKKWIEYFFKNS